MVYIWIQCIHTANYSFQPMDVLYSNAMLSYMYIDTIYTCCCPMDILYSDHGYHNTYMDT